MEEKPSFFSWFTRKSTTKPMGAELGTTEGVKAHIQKLKGDVVKTSRIVQNNLEKYKEIKKFNEALTKTYVQNLVVFRDVNEMLQSCLGVFQSLEQEFKKLEEATGQELNTTDFDYLSNMTKAKIDNLNTELNKQAEMLKKIYTQYGRPEELNRIILAQTNMNKLVEDATATYKKVNAPDQYAKKKREPVKVVEPNEQIDIAEELPQPITMSNQLDINADNTTNTAIQQGGLRKGKKQSKRRLSKKTSPTSPTSKSVPKKPTNKKTPTSNRKTKG